MGFLGVVLIDSRVCGRTAACPPVFSKIKGHFRTRTMNVRRIGTSSGSGEGIRSLGRECWGVDTCIYRAMTVQADTSWCIMATISSISLRRATPVRVSCIDRPFPCPPTDGLTCYRAAQRRTWPGAVAKVPSFESSVADKQPPGPLPLALSLQPSPRRFWNLASFRPCGGGTRALFSR